MSCLAYELPGGPRPMDRPAVLLAMIVGWQTGRGDAARRSGNWLTCLQARSLRQGWHHEK